MAPKIEFIEKAPAWRHVLSARKLARDAILAAVEESGAELRWDKLDYDTWRVHPARAVVLLPAPDPDQARRRGRGNQP